MDLKDKFKCLIGGYYGIRTMDNYDLKVYILNDIENHIKNFIKLNPIDNFNYEEAALKYEKELSLKTKLQDSLIILHEIEAPMEIVFLVKLKIKELNNQ